MDDEIIIQQEADKETDGQPDYRPVNRFDASVVHHLSGMYQNWFLDYASYVILDRAVPHIEDGLKPVQRRILHSMKRMDDGRYNKVANIVGHTMQFHPHGDASIGDALVQMGQKDLLIDTQGNWGNILTGSSAAAPRYIEARLSKFALETVFNPKTTEWQMSYDGRNKEPVTLPVKFPLLLAQGVEGIAVGLNSKIMPHNFCEICDAAIAYLRGEEFHLYPDFPTGGSIDVSKYNDGQRGGSIKVRAKIEKLDQKTLVIRDIPFSKTSETLIASITKAVERGKIKVRKVEDLTAANVEILVHLTPGVSSDKTLDALYAFTDCEISISPNCCVIKDRKPQFLSVSDVLRSSADQTMELLRRELQIRRDELLEQLFLCSLERIFIEERIYKDKKYENAASIDAACEHIDERLTPFYPQLVREVTKDDILRLMEIKMKRILKFSKDQADDLIAKIKAEIAGIERDLGRMVDITCEWFEYLKAKYGAEHPRLTEIRSFDTIEATKVVEANEKLYIDRQEGFIGTSLKKAEFVCNCSDIDDIIIFYRDGKFKIIRVADKIDVGKNVLHLGVWKKGDRRTIYNCVYRDGKNGRYFVKRFFVDSCTRDREYDITQGTKDSRVMYFTVNPNGEAEVIKVTHEPGPRIKKIFFDYDFATLDIKGRGSKGNILTKYPVHKIGLKSHGHSTLGGREVWWDRDVNRLNYDAHGESLGKFLDTDSILVVLSNGDFYITTPDPNNHFEQDILRIEKWEEHKPWTAVLLDADNNGFGYIKRFEMEAIKNHRSFLGDNGYNKLLLLTDTPFPYIRVTFGGNDSFREPMEIDCEEFIAVKGFKAKGKRISTFAVDKVEELEPKRVPETSSEGEGEDEDIAEEENLDPDAGKTQQQVKDEMTGQLNLFES
ncbi:MAG: DNA gyrase/topoisomerase IV subunit A [Prevotella sp.]|nr:DNA gyrase/topoisomerase IV subunit A [Prevotella sp.]